jgi:hypothetical protein
LLSGSTATVVYLVVLLIDVAPSAVLTLTMTADMTVFTPRVTGALPLLAVDSHTRTSVVDLFSLVYNAKHAKGSATRPATVTC